MTHNFRASHPGSCGVPEMNAASSRPFSTPAAFACEEASSSFTSTSVKLARKDENKSAKKPVASDAMTPTRSSPVSPRCTSLRSMTACWRWPAPNAASRINRSPAKVRRAPLRLRSNSDTPRRHSSDWMRRLMVDWERFSASAARRTLPSSATTIAYLRCLRSSARSGMGLHARGSQTPSGAKAALNENDP
jgi:hypothetical protein